MPVQTQLQIRRDTAANWSSTNPTLASGEWGLETDTRQYKIGDGATAWNSLGYQLGPLLDQSIATNPICNYFDGTGFVMLGGPQRESLTSPDSAALDITGDIDIRIKVKLDDWTPAAIAPLVRKWADLNRSYALDVNTNGTLVLTWTTGGSVLIPRTSTVATGFADGATKWVRATLDVDDGAGNHIVKFYTSDDGSTWTQLGNNVGASGITSIYSGTAVLELGSNNNHGDKMVGVLYRVQIRNGIDGTIAFDADLASVPSDSFAFTESSANAATVSLVTGRYSFGLPGATLTASAIASTPALPANTTYYQFIQIRKPITIKHLAFEPTTAPASNATVRIAIYGSDAQQQPTGAPLLQSGAITVSSTAAAIYRIRVSPTILVAGNYIICINSTVGFAYRYWQGGIVFAANILGANLVVQRSALQTLSGDYPTTPVKWNSVAVSQNAPSRNTVLLGWS